MPVGRPPRTPCRAIDGDWLDRASGLTDATLLRRLPASSGRRYCALPAASTGRRFRCSSAYMIPMCKNHIIVCIGQSKQFLRTMADIHRWLLVYDLRRLPALVSGIDPSGDIGERAAGTRQQNFQLGKLSRTIAGPGWTFPLRPGSGPDARCGPQWQRHWRVGFRLSTAGTIQQRYHDR